MELFPLFLKLSGRLVLVVGAGPVAEKKILDLVSAEANVRVVAPQATEAIATLAKSGRLIWLKRNFEESDATDAWLVIAATSDPIVQERVAKIAEQHRTFTIAVDDVVHATAYSGSVLRRAPFIVAISSSGEAPALARLLREILEQALPEESWVSTARSLRTRWRREKTPMASRFAELLRAFKERT